MEWGLRDYGTETVRVWDGDPECTHEWEDEIIQKTRGTAKGSTAQVGNQLREIQGTEVKQGNFCVKCGAWRGSLGLEPHPQLFIDHLVEIFREIKRVLKPTGTFWLNLGDTYFGGSGWRRDKNQTSKLEGGLQFHGPLRDEKKESSWLQPKQLLGIPWRVAIALQNDGWILRNDICWWKPNAMPSSVKDRLTCAYEHIFLFAQNPRYYFDLDSIRKLSTSTPWSSKSSKEPYQQNNPRKRYDGKFKADIAETLSSPRARQSTRESTSYYHPRGKNPGDLWRIPTTPFPGAHFATFPPKLIEPIIKAGCPEKGIVLDPFAGSGTALRVARRLGRIFIGIEINPEYAEMARQRVRGKYKPAPEGVTPLTQIMEDNK